MFTRRLRITTMLVAPLLAGLIGAAVVQPDAEAAGTRRMTVPAAAFGPMSSTVVFDNDGDSLSTLGSAYAEYGAPLFFPSDRVRIDRVILRVYDNGPDGVCVTLYRAQPGAGATSASLAHKCSTGAQATDPRTFADTTISPNWTAGWYGPYLWIMMPPGSNYRFYGVTIEWTPL
jgi:hypothetical protein